MGYCHKRNGKGEIASRKSGHAASGDKMLPYRHYNPSKAIFYRADKTTVKTLFGITATHRMHIEPIDVKSAYLHEHFAHNGSETVYVKQPPRFNRTYKHKCQGPNLKMNTYGTPSAGHTYITALFALLCRNRFQQSEADLCLSKKF